jgi:GAF domain-containing protein
LKYEEWKENPDVKLNMISYFGLPITWPDQNFFGIICVLDNKENAYNDTFKQLISEFKTSIEKDLELLCQTHSGAKKFID